MRYWMRVLLAASALFLGSPPFHAQASASIQVDVPAKHESTIAPGRNFYVKGTYTLPAGYTASQVAVNMYHYGSQEVVRRVQGNVKNPPLWVEGNTSVSFNSWGSVEDIKSSGMPELIWDGVNPDSFYQGYRKCYFDDIGFAALIPGGEGEIDDGMTLLDEGGSPYPVLASGDYWLEISVSCQDSLGNQNIIKWSRPITIGVTENKLLSRFSPDIHMSRITEWAGMRGYRIYSGPFAGNWWGSNFEIPGEMRASDLTEYSAGKSHFVIYNVSSGSTAYKVELARLQQQGVVNHSERLANYYYKYGEPTLKDGRESDITAFETGDKLQLTRAEVGENISGETGVYHQDDTAVPEYDLDFSDGVQAETGDRIAIYGVAAPIQISQADIQEIGPGTDKNSFLLNNKISTLHYEINGSDISQEMDEAVVLNRISGGGDNFSELEFKHVLEITEEMAAKDLDVSITGYDAHGQAVAGTEESFQIHVASNTQKPEVTPSPQPDPEVTPSPSPQPLKKPGRTKITSYSSTPRTASMKWKKVCGADQYAVYRYSRQKNKWVKIAETNKTSYKNRELLPARDYWFRIRSIRQSSDGRRSYGDYSSSVKILTHPEVPRKVRVRQTQNTAVCGNAVLTMNVSKRADGYYVYQLKNGRYRVAYKIVGTKVYQRTGTKKQKVYHRIGTAKLKNGKITCTLPGVSRAEGCQAYFKVRSYATRSGCRQQNSLYSKPKKLY